MPVSAIDFSCWSNRRLVPRRRPLRRMANAATAAKRAYSAGRWRSMLGRRSVRSTQGGAKCPQSICACSRAGSADALIRLRLFRRQSIAGDHMAEVTGVASMTASVSHNIQPDAVGVGKVFSVCRMSGGLHVDLRGARRRPDPQQPGRTTTHATFASTNPPGPAPRSHSPASQAPADHRFGV